MQALGGVMGYLTAFLVFRRDCNQTCTEKNSTAFNVRSQRLLSAVVVPNPLHRCFLMRATTYIIAAC